MGILYSIVSYFYNQQSQIPPEQIKLSAQRLSIGMKIKMTKIQKINHQLETEFIEMINQPKRDLFLERLKIDNMLQGSINYGGTLFIKSSPLRTLVLRVTYQEWGGKHIV